LVRRGHSDVHMGLEGRGKEKKHLSLNKDQRVPKGGVKKKSVHRRKPHKKKRGPSEKGECEKT